LDYIDESSNPRAPLITPQAKMILNFIFSCGTMLRGPMEGHSNPESFSMIVCHCRGLSDRAIREVIRRGAQSPREVAIACHAGRSCGGCIPAVRALIQSESSTCASACADLPVAAAS
jgi:bacterioferritin-associated ferredoxin